MTPDASESEGRPNWRTELPEFNAGTTPEKALARFMDSAESLYKSLIHGDDEGTRGFMKKLHTIQSQCPDVIPDDVIREHEARVSKLKAHAREVADEVITLRQIAVAGAKEAKQQQVARAIRRLTAIHAAHPGMLGATALEDVHRSVANAADERDRHQETTRKLLERERSIAAEVKVLAAAVRHFHDVARHLPVESDEFREAEESYFRIVQKVGSYDTEWFSSLVLEMADLLAEWAVPPYGAAGQIDRFLDSINAGLAKIRSQIRRIKSEEDPDENGNGANS